MHFAMGQLAVLALALALIKPVKGFLPRHHTTHKYPGNLFSAHRRGDDFTSNEMQLTLELRTPLLEESLDFFESNFGLEVLRHEEFVGPDDSTCWSRTDLSPHLALLYLYNTTHYRRGNDLRYLAMRRSSYRGPEDAVVVDDNGAEYVEGPTFWVRLLPSPNAADDPPVGGAFMYASLHVSDRPSSLKAYRSMLGASGGSSTITLPSWVGLELVELPQGQVLTPSVAVPLFSDEDRSGSVERGDVATRVVSLVLHGKGGAANSNLSWAWTDPDGLVVQQRIFEVSPPSNTTVRIDWASREERQERLRARARARRSSSSSSTASRLVQLDPSSYSQSIAGCRARGNGIVIEMVVPWCPRCVALKPGLEALAACLGEEEDEDEGGGIKNKDGKGRPAVAFFAVDASDRRFGYLHQQDVELQTALAWSQRVGFPSLFFLPPPGPYGEIGDVEVYEGKTRIRAVREWVERVAGVDAAASACYRRDSDNLASLEEVEVIAADEDEQQENNPDDSRAGDNNQGDKNDVVEDEEDDDDDDDCCVL